MTSATALPSVPGRSTSDLLGRFLAVATALVAGLAVIVPSPAAAAAFLVDETDPRGDVRITRASGLGEAARKSIDLRSVRIVARDDRTVRFTVAIKRVMRERRFDQMFFILMEPPRDSDQRWYAQVGFTSKGRMSYANFSGEYGGPETWCEGIDTMTAPEQGKVAVDVPRRCLPTRVARIQTTSVTGLFRSDAPTWSSDRHRISGLIDVTP